MAYLISGSSGDFTAAGSWGLVDATSLLDSEVGTTTVSTANIDSQAFTPGAITIDGIAIKVAARVASPTGTLTIRLINSGTSATIDSVVINVTDIQNAGTAVGSGQGWIFAKFANPVALAGATAYKVRLFCSSTNQLTVYRDGTTANISRMLRTTTNQAPAAGDTLLVVGAKTSAGNMTACTITMDQTANTDYGALLISDGGTVTYGSASATNYLLRLSGLLDVYAGGALRIGTVATPCPRNSTCVLEFDCTSDGEFGLRVFNLGTLEMQGQSRTAGNNTTTAFLTANVSIGATTLPLDTDTGWLDGDTICIASTTRTATQSEKRVLSGNANPANCVITSGLSAAHDGVSPIQAEVGLLTRNVVLRSVSSTAMTYVLVNASSIVNIDWAQFYYIGTNVAGKKGIEIRTTSAGSFNMAYSSMHDGEAHALSLIVTTNDNITVENCIFYNFATVTGGLSLCGMAAATSGTNIIFDNILFMQLTTCSAVFVIQDIGITATNITVVGGGTTAGIYLQESSAVATGTFNNWIAHSSGLGAGIQVSPTLIARNLTISNIKSYRNTSFGLLIGQLNNAVIDTCELFGNGTSNLVMNNYCSYVTMLNVTANGDTTFSTATGLTITAAMWINTLKLIDCDFGTASGIKTTHSTADVTLSACVATIGFDNTKFSSTTEFTALSSCLEPSLITSQRHDRVNGAHKSMSAFGTISLSSATYRTASPSEQMSPSSTSVKLRSGSKYVSVPSGSTIAIAVWVMKDGSYNGNAPRLILRRNTPAGVSSDTVLATFSAGTNTWQRLSGTTVSVIDDAVLEFYIDCDGTAGSIYVDDWTAS